MFKIRMVFCGAGEPAPDYPGGGYLEQIKEKLLEELQTPTAFTIPIGKGIPITESVVVSWIVMAVLILAALLLTRNLKVENVVIFVIQRE